MGQKLNFYVPLPQTKIKKKKVPDNSKQKTKGEVAMTDTTHTHTLSPCSVMMISEPEVAQEALSILG